MESSQAPSAALPDGPEGSGAPQVGETVSLAPAQTIAEVIERMTALDASFDAEDGVAWFNRMYLHVTEDVRSTGETTFENEPFLDALDVEFANFYFDAVAKVDRGEACPAAWAPLFEHRHRAHTSRLQFALVGMNAHINHDLPLAIVKTATDHAVEPFGNSPYERDFFRVNDLLAGVEGKIKSWFTVGVLADIDRYLSGIDDALSMWCIHGARRAAWDAAALLWRMRAHPHLAKDYEDVLAGLVNLAGRAVLV